MSPLPAGNVADPPKEDRITRCVRPAFLLSDGEGELHRKQWVVRRLEELADILAAAAVGFSVMDNHLHLLVRIDRAAAHPSK
jgi:hypothetical protein